MAWIQNVFLAFFTVVTIAAGDCTIEGHVKLPAASAGGGTLASARYKALATRSIGPPPLPVAVVYLEGTFPDSMDTNPPPAPAVLQKQFQFVPGVLPVRKGTRVTFPNLDEEYHNVLSYSRTKEFDLGRYLQGEKPPTVLFDKAGVVELNCEIHEHMRGYVLVLETPYFTMTAPNGDFRLERLPPGKHVLRAWINPKTVLQRAIELQEGVLCRVTLPSTQ